MAQYIGVRSLGRQRIRVVNSAGTKVTLSPTVDTVVDLDLQSNRRALASHAAIGQYIVTAANASTGANTALPSDS